MGGITQPQPSKGKAMTGGNLFTTTAQQRQYQYLGSLCITTVQQRQDQDQGKPKKNYISAKIRPRPREACAYPKPRRGKAKTGEAYSLPQTIKGMTKTKEVCAQPQPSRGKTKSGGTLNTTTAQQRQDCDWGKPFYNHSPAQAGPIPWEVCVPPQSSKGEI